MTADLLAAAILQPDSMPNLVHCPYCREPLAGLLDACAKPACIKADMDDTTRYERWCDGG